MMNTRKIFIFIFISLFFSNIAFSKSICEGASYYKWKNYIVKKSVNAQNKDNKTLSEKENLSFYSVISSSGENEEEAKKNLKFELMKKQGDIIIQCKNEHESLSSCIANKYSELKKTLSDATFVARKHIEESIKQECEEKQGICQEVVMKNEECKEIKEKEETQEDEKSDGKKGKKNDKKGKGKK